MPMSQLSPIVFKLVPKELEELDRIVRAKGYDSRSSAMRHALGLLFEHWGIEKEADQQIEKERKRHKPRWSRNTLPVKVIPVVKPMSKPKQKMSASRARKSSV